MVKIWRDKSGKWITPKEFKDRFLKGVEGVTPLQQLYSQIVFTWITIVGLLCGITVSIFTFKNLWWLMIILLAGLGNTIVGLIGTYQRYWAVKNVEKLMNEFNIPSEPSPMANNSNPTANTVNTLAMLAG